MADLEIKKPLAEETLAVTEKIKEPPKGFWQSMCDGNPLGMFFKRNPGSIEPLDGMRAVAILWVMALHSGLFWGDYLVCAVKGWYFHFSTSPTKVTSELTSFSFSRAS